MPPGCTLAGRHSCLPGGPCREAFPGASMETNEKDDFDLQGRIGCFSLSDLLQTLSFTQKTGTLTLIQGWNTRTICYEQGRITYLAAATRSLQPLSCSCKPARLDQKQLLHTLGPNWKRMLGVQDPEHVAPDSRACRRYRGCHAPTATATKFARLRLRFRPTAPTPPTHTSTSFDDLEAFVPPDYSASPAARNAPDPSAILLKYKLATPEELPVVRRADDGNHHLHPLPLAKLPLYFPGRPARQDRRHTRICQRREADHRRHPPRGRVDTHLARHTLRAHGLPPSAQARHRPALRRSPRGAHHRGRRERRGHHRPQAPAHPVRYRQAACTASPSSASSSPCPPTKPP